MKVLAFDTCFSACSAAAGKAVGGGVPVDIVAREHALLEAGHAEALVPMIERVMAAAGWRFADLDRIVVTRGPGTFTGVRTGVAVARALALATPAKLVGVSSLWAIGLAARERMGAAASGETGVLVAMDARKSMVYAQVIASDGRELNEPQLLEPAAAAGLAPEMRVTVVGTGTSIVTEAALSIGRPVGVDQAAAIRPAWQMPDAAILIAAAHRAPCQGPLQPLYLRPPDAKPQSGKALPWSST